MLLLQSLKEWLPECVHVNARSALVLVLTVRRKTDLINENDIVVSTACINKRPEREREEERERVRKRERERERERVSE